MVLVETRFKENSFVKKTLYQQIKIYVHIDMKISMCRKMSLYVQHEMPNVPILFYFYWYLVSGIYYKTLKEFATL